MAVPLVMSDSRVQEFREVGFAVWRSRFTAKQMQELADRIGEYRLRLEPERLAATYDDPADPATLKSMNKMNQCDAWFDQILDELAEALLGYEVIVRNVEWFDTTSRRPPGMRPARPLIKTRCSPACSRPRA